MKITGFFKLKAKDENGNVIDTYEHKNTIMDNGRVNVMNWLMGAIDNTSLINKIIIGTGGYNGGSNPSSFNSNRTQTFSEENSDEYWYADFDINTANITTTGTGKTVQATITNEEGTPTNNSTITVTTDETNFSLTYLINIPQTNANGSGVRQYSEAALYCNGAPDALNRIFAMRTFPTRAKDNTIQYEIEWTITFG